MVACDGPYRKTRAERGRHAPFQVLVALLLGAQALSCQSREVGLNEGGSEELSTQALRQLIPDASKRKVAEQITHNLWLAMQPYGCRSCHSTPQGEGWENAKYPYWDFFKSSVYSHLDLLDPEVSKIKAPNFRLYRMLSGEVAPVMPPRAAAEGADAQASLLHLVKGFDDRHMREVANRVSAAKGSACPKGAEPKECRAGLADALGHSPLFTTREGLCIDKVRLRQLANVPSLCDVFERLAVFANRMVWFNNKRAIEEWIALTENARKKNHYDPKEGKFLERPVFDAGAGQTSSTGVLAGTQGGQVAGKGRILFTLPGSNTVSYYTRVAPDDSWIAVTQTGPEKYIPSIVRVAQPATQHRLQNMSYDPTFSPDFSESEAKGFVFGARGFNASELAKVYSFFLPGTTGQPVASFNFDDISGYGTVAQISAATAPYVAEVWKKLWEKVGDYFVIMGKRWRWVAVKTTQAGGRVNGVQLVSAPERGLPGGSATAPPVCGQFTDSTGRNDTSVAFAESMMSQDGRFIALNSQRDGALLIINTKNCAIEHAPSLQQKYLQGSKVAFSNDGQFVAFHAFGEDGLAAGENSLAANHAIRNLAQAGRVANLFVYSTRTKQTRQITNYKKADKTVAWFPNFNGDASRLYYHRHVAGKPGSEVLVIENPVNGL